MKRVFVLGTVLITVLALAGPALAQPDNDDLAGAAEISALPFQEVVDTTSATTEPGEPVEEESCPPRGSTVWYALSLQESQEVMINTAGSDYDTTLAVYTGTDYTDLSLVDCNDDTFFGLQAALTISADAGVTYLIQAGSFGGDGGGELHISVGEPGKTKGKPLIFKSKFKGLVADAFVEEFDEVTGTFTFSSANLVDGQSSEGGKPSKFSSLFVSSVTETIDETNETFTFVEWFGFVDLDGDEFAIDKKLKQAWVLTDITLEGFECTGTFDEEEFDCVPLGTVESSADLQWSGVGGVTKTKFSEKTTFDGTRFRFRGTFSSRDADVSGGLTGDLELDFDGAFGSLSHQSSGDFIMIRGGG